MHGYQCTNVHRIPDLKWTDDFIAASIKLEVNDFFKSSLIFYGCDEETFK